MPLDFEDCSSKQTVRTVASKRCVHLGSSSLASRNAASRSTTTGAKTQTPDLGELPRFKDLHIFGRFFIFLQKKQKDVTFWVDKSLEITNQIWVCLRQFGWAPSDSAAPHLPCHNKPCSMAWRQVKATNDFESFFFTRNSSTKARYALFLPFHDLFHAQKVKSCPLHPSTCFLIEWGVR